jgi:nucleoside triphosphate diphosphatase
LCRAMSGRNAGDIRDEMGDVLFTCVNLARHLGLDAEETLRHATGKFERRFSLMEASAAADGGDLSALSETQLDRLWREAKESLGGDQRGL